MTQGNETPEASIPFDDVDLHDAVLREVRILWKARMCELYMSVLLDTGKSAVPCVLRGQGLQSISIPHHSPWGDSVFINRQSRAPDGRFLIEVQSGDVIEIEATSLSLFRLANTT